MLSHNLLLIFRNFKRFKSSFIINLVGLSTGLACTLLIYLWVDDELKVDKFHANDARLYELMEFQRNSSDNIRITNSTPGLLAEELDNTIPEVEYSTVVTPFYWFDKSSLSLGEKNIEAGGIYASKDFFNVFSFGLTEGDPAKALAEKHSIVISESTALALFNSTDNVVGKRVEYQHEKEYIVSGIFKGTPPNSTQQFDFVLSFEDFKEINKGVLNWGNSGPMTFVVLKEGSDETAFNDKIKDIIGTKVPEKHRTLFAAKYSDLYLHGEFENGKQSGGRIEYVVMFSLIALFILAVACINFMNLSTAKASRRLKEVGIKKAVGSSRRALILQFLFEALFMAFLSLVVAVMIVVVVMPVFNYLTGKSLQLHPDASLIMKALALTLVTGLIAGSYPAFYMSGFKAISMFRGTIKKSFSELF